MGKLQEYDKKVIFIITAEQKEKLEKLVPWGTLSTLYRLLTDDLIDLLEKDRDLVIGCIMNRKLKAEQFLKLKDGKPYSNIEVKNNDNKRD